MNINIGLDKGFEEWFNHLSEKHGEAFLELNGFAPDQLNFTGFIDYFAKATNVAEASIDGNSNVTRKDICTLESEMNKPHLKLLAFNKIFHTLRKMEGLETAQRLIESEWTGVNYLHDASSSTFRPYCHAYDLSELATKGLFFIQGFNSGAPKHLSTFTDFVIEFVSYVSNRSSGACGLPDFLIWAFYFWKKDCETGYYTRSPEYHAEQTFQTFCYKLNQPFLRKDQSAFTNISIFDREYLQAIFGGREYPDGTFVIDYIEEIIDFQKKFMEVCSDIRNTEVMTFPVLTFSLLYQDGSFVDEEFAKWACKHNMRWNDSNFYASPNITSLSNCCRLVSGIEDLYFNSIGGTALEVGSVKVNTINLARVAYESGGDKQLFLEILKSRTEDTLLMLKAIRHIIQRNIEKGLLPNFSYGLLKLDNLYLTIGIIGVYEVMKSMGFVLVDEFGNHSYSFEGLEFAEEFLGLINGVKDKFIKETGYRVNVEQIPKITGDMAA